MPSHAGMRPEVSRVLYDRKLAQAAAAAGDPVGLSAAEGGSGGSGNRPAAIGAGGLMGAGELQLLEQHGCMPAAEGVYSILTTWLQQQATDAAGQSTHQQQQQQASSTEAGEGDVRLQSAAAAAAALAPRLLVSVLRQQGDLPAPKLVSVAPRCGCA